MANPKGIRDGKASVSVKTLLTQIAKVPGCQGHSVCLMANPKGIRDGKPPLRVKALLTQIAKVTGCQGHSVCLMANLKGIRNGKASVSVKPLFTQIAKVPGCQGHSVYLVGCFQSYGANFACLVFLYLAQSFLSLSLEGSAYHEGCDSKLRCGKAVSGAVARQGGAMDASGLKQQAASGAG